MKIARRTSTRRAFVLRPYRRIPTWYSSHYMSERALGKGVVKDLSRTGLCLLGDHSLTPGTTVSVRLNLDGTNRPLEIGRASVRWSNDYEFGVRFDHLTADAAQRLAALIAAESRLPQPVRPDPLRSL